MTCNKIPILTYHSIDNSGSIISVSPSRFKDHMRFLNEAEISSISLEEIIKCISTGKEFPKKSIAITFDDGFKSVYSDALPVLEEFGFTATIFLVAEKCGEDNQWDRQLKKIPHLNLLNREEIIEMSGKGIAFGSHTLRHPNLSILPMERVAEEITGSKSIIQKLLKKGTLFFAYPYGDESKKIKDIVKKEFHGACSNKMGYVTLKSDIYSLPRIEMYYFSQNNFFRYIETSFFPSYIKLRSIPRLFKF